MFCPKTKSNIQRRVHVRSAHGLIMPWLVVPLAIYELNIVLPQQPGHDLLYLGMRKILTNSTAFSR